VDNEEVQYEQDVSGTGSTVNEFHMDHIISDPGNRIPIDQFAPNISTTLYVWSVGVHTERSAAGVLPSRPAPQAAAPQSPPASSRPAIPILTDGRSSAPAILSIRSRNPPLEGARRWKVIRSAGRSSRMEGTRVRQGYNSSSSSPHCSV
jgi:hypothetical protein